MIVALLLSAAALLLFGKSAAEGGPGPRPPVPIAARTPPLGALGTGAALCSLVVLGASVHGAIAAAAVGIGAAATARGARRGARASRQSAAAREAPLFLEVVASQLRAGAPVSVALDRAAPLAPAPVQGSVREVAGLVRLGAAPTDAWQALDGTVLGDLALLARRSSDSGVRLAEQCRLLARDLREGNGARAEAAARRAGVWAMAPLGACFLPAFFCLGVLPVILGLGQEVLGGTAQ